jgi:D-beta-D-heptose 7-phosphate kinase/D-beta-D-heptose 1-phosphate adenosyltransferase
MPGATSADLTLSRLEAAARRMARTSVLVVGDAMLDRTVFGEVMRISPEAPVPVLNVLRELAVPGGAGNVVRNLGSIGAAAAFVSVVGDDQAGSDLTGLIGGQPGVEPWLLVEGGRSTTLKTRFVAEGGHYGQQLLRADREDTAPINPKLAERLLRIARDAMAATSVTILSDYRKGVLAGGVPAQLIAAAKQAGRRIIADLRGEDFARYAGADVIMPGVRDLGRFMGMRVESDAAVAAAADALRRTHGFGAVLVTRGEDGMTLVHEGGTRHFAAEAVDVFDVSGAGDTAVAVLGAALAGGVDIETAAFLANLAAGIAVGRAGTAVVHEGDLLSAMTPAARAQRKIVQREPAAVRVERWRQRGWRIGFANGCFDPLRPGHVHLIEQARAVCDRLVVGVAGDAVVLRHKGAGRPLQPAVMRAASLAALPWVDLVVIYDEDAPGDLLQALRPDILVNGANRAAEDVSGAELMREWGGKVILANLLPEGAAE